MRVCIVASSYPRFDEDGSARFVRSIAEAQAACGHEVHVLAPYAPQVRPYASPAQLHWFRYIWPARLGVMGHAMSLENDQRLRRSTYLLAPFFFIAQTIALMRIVRRERIDAIHAHWVIPNGVAAALVSRLFNVPLYISLHGSDVYLANKNALLGRMAGWAFRRARGVASSSPELTAGAVRTGAARERIRMIPYGVEPQPSAHHAEPSNLRDRLGIPHDAPVVLGLGRLVAKKGYDRLVDAAPLVLADHPNARFVIVGDGPLQDDLMQRAHALQIAERVIFPGRILFNEIPEYMSMSSIFVVPSVHDASGNVDGLPTILLQAMAAGVPVVATRVGGIPLAVDDGRTGLLIDEADAQSLAGVLDRLLGADDMRAEMGRAARTRIETELSWDAYARQLDRMYAA